MFSFVKNIDLLKAKKVAGVEVLLSAGGELYNVVVVEKKNDKVQIVSTEQGLDFEQFKQKIDKNIPLFLSVDGKGVLHKKLSFTEEENNAQLLSKVLPGADEQQFYVQSAGEFVSVLRRDTLDVSVNEFKKSGYFIVAAALGPFALNSILSLVVSKVVHTSLNQLNINDAKIDALGKAEATALKVNIADEQLNASSVVAFASALNYFVNTEAFFEAEIIQSSNIDFKEKRKLVVGGVAVLVFFFVLLFVNYLVYDSLKSSNNELEAQFKMQEDDFNKSEILKKELDEKIALKEKLGVNGSTRISSYLDEIAASVPAAIQLTELSLNPVEKKIKDDKEIEYDVNQIVIAGRCKKSIYYNDWKKDLSKMEWVKNISVVNYIDADDEVGEFILKITF